MSKITGTSIPEACAFTRFAASVAKQLRTWLASWFPTRQRVTYVRFSMREPDRDSIRRQEDRCREFSRNMAGDQAA